MKTTYTINDVEQFLANIESEFIRGSIKQLTEGHTLQVFSFKTNTGNKYVIRLRESKKDLQVDQYAFRNFSHSLTIPEVTDIGIFDDTTHYVMTRLIEVETLNILSQDSFNKSLNSVKEVIANTFKTDISNTSGSGNPNFETSNAPAFTWKESLQNELTALNPEELQQSAANIGLSKESVDTLIKQFNTYLPYVSEYRRLLHGDPGGDNVIVNGNSVAALLDWEQMAYGD